jgi:hypothetical protein
LRIAWVIYSKPKGKEAAQYVYEPEESGAPTFSKQSDILAGLNALSFDKVYVSGGENEEDCDGNELHMK